MVIALVGIVIGIAIGLYIPLVFSGAFGTYISVVILATLDTIFRAFEKDLKQDLNLLVMLSEYLFDISLVILLVFMGNRLGLPLYYAAIFVFGVRLFNSVKVMRLYIFDKNKQKS